MSEKITLEQVVILEGKYDKIKMESLLDAIIIQTDGFQIYKDKEKQKMIRMLASEHGALIATDPDAAGFQIRGFLRSLLKGCTVYELLLPDIFGKEKRKDAPSKEGKLGLEGMHLSVLRKALEECGIQESEPFDGGITMADFFDLGLTGRSDSSSKRKALAGKMNLPERISCQMLLSVINRRMDLEGLKTFMESK